MATSKPDRARLLSGDAHGQTREETMKWFLAGMALVIVSLAGGIAAIVVGYRQVITRYIGAAPDEKEKSRD